MHHESISCEWLGACMGWGLPSETKEAGLSLADRADDLVELNRHLVAV